MIDRKSHFYVCNGKREGCGGSSVCRVPGGCWHTADIFYALYEEHTEFMPVYSTTEPPRYWETIRTENEKKG